MVDARQALQRAMRDPDTFFTTLGEEVARQAEEPTDELIGEIR